MSGEIPQDRKELYESAISFLKDSAVSSAPLAQKIEFLQGKGLTQEEIQQALKESSENYVVDNGRPSPSNSEHVRVQKHELPRYEAIPPPLPNRDWKDYFIMATASVGLFYGAYQLTKRYIIPQFLPEPQSKLEQDKELVNEQFDKVEKLLFQIEQEHSQSIKKEESKFEELDKVLIELQSVLDENLRAKQRFETELNLLKVEFNNIQSSVDKLMKTNNSQKEFMKLNDELKSLKNLIKTSTLSISSQNNSEQGDGKSKISPMSTGPVPGVNAIPSAADILAKMDLNNTSRSPSTDTNTPAWKKAREETTSTTSSSSTIPEWQKTMNAGASHESS